MKFTTLQQIVDQLEKDGGKNPLSLSLIESDAFQALKRMASKPVVKSHTLLDLLEQLRGRESLMMEKYPVNQYSFTLQRHPGHMTSAVMPADHHCDLERIIDLVDHLQKRLDDEEK